MERDYWTQLQTRNCFSNWELELETITLNHLRFSTHKSYSFDAAADAADVPDVQVELVT